MNVYVDFDGDGRSGYNFMVGLSNDIADSTISNENQFNGDWDGHWTHAVSEDDDGWSAEMLIPWHIAPMRQGDGGTRTIGLALDRVVGDSNERMAWPAISFNEQRYLSELRKVEVPQYSQSLLAITPYVVGLYDNVGGKADFDAGADIFWKPNGQFQLSGTINPDFGQVESDGIVVNFGAIETFFGDKRRSSPRTRAISKCRSARSATPSADLHPPASARSPTTGAVPATWPQRSRSTAASAASATGCSPPPRMTRSVAISMPCALPAISKGRASARC